MEYVLIQVLGYYVIYILVGYGIMHRKIEVTYESENPPLKTKIMVAVAMVIALTFWLPILIAAFFNKNQEN